MNPDPQHCLQLSKKDRIQCRYLTSSNPDQDFQNWYDLFITNVSDPGCLYHIRSFLSRIQGQKDMGSRIRIKEVKFFQLKKLFLSSRKYDPGCSSRILDMDLDFLPLPDPGSRGHKGTGSRIRNTL